MVTVKDKYAEYGIQYNPKTSKIFCDPIGIWVSEMLTYDTNTKVGAAYTFSALHGNETYHYEDLGKKARAYMDACGIKEIKGTCKCHCDGCYCDSGRYPSDSVRAALVIRTIIIRNHLEWFERAVIAQIRVREVKQIRIHAAGDFYSEEYVEVWKRIIVATADTCKAKWSYTKQEFAEDAFDDLPTMSLVKSMTPVGINYGKCGELLRKKRELEAMGYDVHICACGTPYEKHCADCTVGCKRNCNKASTEGNKKQTFVLFILHSVRGYIAGKNDPEDYAEILDIIKNQVN